MLRILQCFIYIHYMLTFYRFTWVCRGWKHSTLGLETKISNRSAYNTILSRPITFSSSQIYAYVATIARSHKPVSVEMLPLKSYECFTLRHTQIERVCVALNVSVKRVEARSFRKIFSHKSVLRSHRCNQQLNSIRD